VRYALAAFAVLATAAAASCTTPREKPLVLPEPRVREPTPSRSDYVEGPYFPPGSYGTVETRFALGAPVIIAGDSHIEPDEGTRRVIAVSGVDEVTGLFEICNDADGTPVKVVLTRSTAYAIYDKALDEGIRQWRFIPPEVRGEYVSSCTSVQITYRPSRR
jgi:hypothetical protein